jgi:hypothetical protein
LISFPASIIFFGDEFVGYIAICDLVLLSHATGSNPGVFSALEVANFSAGRESGAKPEAKPK